MTTTAMAMVQFFAACFFGALGGGSPQRMPRYAPRAPRPAVPCWSASRPDSPSGATALSRSSAASSNTAEASDPPRSPSEAPEVRVGSSGLRRVPKQGRLHCRRWIPVRLRSVSGIGDLEEATAVSVHAVDVPLFFPSLEAGEDNLRSIRRPPRIETGCRVWIGGRSATA